MRKEEILGLQWSQVDLMDGKISLKPEDTKSSEPRVIYMAGELLEVINFQGALRQSKFPDCPWVFFAGTGERIKDLRGSWDKAYLKAGLSKVLIDDQGQSVKDKKGEAIRVPNKLFHDFRRTAVRNMVRAGVPERVAMMISGHKTRTIFDRYNIVNEDDLKKASQRVKEYHLERVNLQSGHSLGTVNSPEAELPLGEQPAIH
jgi:integrase